MLKNIYFEFKKISIHNTYKNFFIKQMSNFREIIDKLLKWVKNCCILPASDIWYKNTKENVFLTYNF